jgi:hypothetical protein
MCAMPFVNEKFVIYAYLCIFVCIGELHSGHVELHLNETSHPGFRGENKFEISWPCT